MLINRFMPRYDVSARYHIDIDAPVERAYSAGRRLDMGDSAIVRWLYRLRGLPRSGLTLDGMLKWGFVLLAEEPSQEFVFGLVGRFWSPFPEIQAIQPEAFIEFNQPGVAKAAGNLAFIPLEGGRGVRVSTETRIYCTCEESRRRFRRYWRLIGPFSGLIRKEWLRLIKRRAEAPQLDV